MGTVETKQWWQPPAPPLDAPRNIKRHACGDVVYVQQYVWPAAVSKYIVNKIRTETGKPDVYFLTNAINGHEQLNRSAWGYEVFDNIEDAFNYKYYEEFQKVT